jgi:DNA topoisomerase-1
MTLEAPGSAAPLAATTSPERSARVARCRYVDDRTPGIRRVMNGHGFQYRDPGGGVVRDSAVLRRIHSLVIPPAWSEVWICPSDDGHIQATGRDARGRKQYRYHSRFREVREETKFQHLIAFAEALPRIRRAVDRDLRKAGIGRDTVLATLVRLLEITLIRIGNEEYARRNGSFGLATMRTRHADISGSALRFRFRGKSGKIHTVSVQDRRLARIVQRCSDLPGEELFQYLDEQGEPRSVEAGDVNDYLRRISGADFTTKDFRTWAGTVLAAQALDALSAETDAKRRLAAAVKDVAGRLGNTPAVCRKCYIHPQVFEAHLSGTLAAGLAGRGRGGKLRGGLSAIEAQVLSFLKRRRAREART